MADTAVLGRDELLSILIRKDFYPVGGPFTAVGQIVQERAAAYKASAAKRCCGPDPSILFPAIDLLFSLLRGPDDTAKQAFKTYLTNHRGRTITTVVMYFRRGHEPAPEKLQF